MGVRVAVHVLDVRTFEKVIYPAYESFADDGELDPLRAVLRTAVETERVRNPGSPAAGELEDMLGELVRREGGARARFVRGQVVPLLVEMMCMTAARPRAASLTLSKPLLSHLYSASEWIEGIFTFRIGIRGGTFEFSPGESSQVLSSEELLRFANELAVVPPPGGGSGLARDLDDLREIVGAVARDSTGGLRLLVTIE